MKYEPIKDFLGRHISDSVFLRKILYRMLDLLLLRAWHVRKALRRLKPLLPEEPVVLDAGSGLGQYAWRMSRNSKWQIKGIDINKDQVEASNNFFRKAGKGNRVRFETGDLTLLRETDIYNLIITVDVMEHIKEDEVVFSNFYRALRGKGLLLLSTPSDLGGSDAFHDTDDSFIEEHVRNGYGYDEITVKLKRAGFSDVRVSYTYGVAGSLSWRLSMKYPVQLLNKSYFFFLILPFYYLIVYPVSVILNFIDIWKVHSKGTGLIVIAEK
jgi:SAM-dependent methyltransferase